MFTDSYTVNRLTLAEVPALKEMLTWLSNDLVLSQEDTPHNHRTVREILIIGWHVMNGAPVAIIHAPPSDTIKHSEPRIFRQSAVAVNADAFRWHLLPRPAGYLDDQKSAAAATASVTVISRLSAPLRRLARPRIRCRFRRQSDVGLCAWKMRRCAYTTAESHCRCRR